MKKKFIIFLGIFIFMIIPKNAYALSGTLPINNSPKIQWRMYNGTASDIYIGSSHSLSSTTDFGMKYYLSTNNTRVISNNNYGLNYLYFNNSGQGYGMCVDNCDVTVSFDWVVAYMGWDTTGRHLANSYFVTLINGDDISNSENLNMFLDTTTLDDTSRLISCTSALTYYQTPQAQGPDYPWYYKFHTTCKTSNISMVNNIFFFVKWWNFNYYTEIGLRVYFSDLSYTTGPYTGTQDNTEINQNIINNIENVNTNITNVNDSINNDNIDSSFQNSTMNNINSQLASNNVISDLLLLPVNMYQRILNSVNATCIPFSLGSLYGTTLTMPCIQPQNYLGSTLWGVIDILFCGFFILAIRKKFVDTFNNMTNLKDRGNDIE